MTRIPLCSLPWVTCTAFFNWVKDLSPLEFIMHWHVQNTSVEEVWESLHQQRAELLQIQDCWHQAYLTSQETPAQVEQHELSSRDTSDSASLAPPPESGVTTNAGTSHSHRLDSGVIFPLDTLVCQFQGCRMALPCIRLPMKVLETPVGSILVSMQLGVCTLGQDAWANIYCSDRTTCNSWGMFILALTCCILNIICKIVDRLGLSYSTGSELNKIKWHITWPSPFETNKFTIGGEHL